MCLALNCCSLFSLLARVSSLSIDGACRCTKEPVCQFTNDKGAQLAKIAADLASVYCSKSVWPGSLCQKSMARGTSRLYIAFVAWQQQVRIVELLLSCVDVETPHARAGIFACRRLGGIHAVLRSPTTIAAWDWQLSSPSSCTEYV